MIHHLSPIFKFVENECQSLRIIPHNVLNDNINVFKCGLVQENNFYGKTTYMSPERVKAHYDGRQSYCMYLDDIYAVGIMIFMSFAGDSPYSETNDLKYLDEIILKESRFTNTNARNKIEKFIPPGAQDLIRKILKPECSRIKINQILDHQWFKNI